MADSQPHDALPNGPSQAAEPGSDLRQRVEALGLALAERLGTVLDGLPGRPRGPQRLGDTLGQTIVTASRLLKAISQSDPIAVVQLLPGPNPLRKTVQSARGVGAGDAVCDQALESIAIFESLIRDEAGDRGALKAMLTAWLPEERREFEAQRRQSVFKALAELDGVSCDLIVDTLVVHPSSAGDRHDLLNVKCMLGIDRIRPDAAVNLASRRVSPRGTEERPRVPLNLDGEPALDGLHHSRLDTFCNAPPAPFLVGTFGQEVQYTLGPTGFGRGSTVDLVLAEWNRDEIEDREPSFEHAPYFFVHPEMPTRKLVFDVLVHKDVYGGAAPELLSYETSSLGPARPNDPERVPDLRPSAEPMQSLGAGTRRLRILEFARYGSLLEHAFGKLGWDAGDLRAFRVAVPYPLVGRQLTLAFTRPSDAAR